MFSLESAPLWAAGTIFVLVAAVFLGPVIRSSDSIMAIISHDRGSIFESYDSKFEGKPEASTLSHDDKACTDEYYKIATDFYEYGWGQSFHFAPRRRSETREASIARLEHLIALKLGLKDGMKVGDLGMGVGGPLRSVVGFCGATVTGVTINQYQGDFTEIVPKVFEPGSLDAVYYCESSVHTPDRVPTFTEAFKALKKGGKLLTYEWAMTDKYNPKDPWHQKVKRAIERGNGIANVIPAKDVVKQLKSVGFKVIEDYDMCDSAKTINGERDIPWYEPLANPWSLQGMQMSTLGRAFNNAFVALLEILRIAPKGASGTAKMLAHGAEGLVDGGRSGIFTPTYFVLAEKI